MTKKELDRIYKLAVAFTQLYFECKYGVKQLTNKKAAKFDTLCTRLFCKYIVLRNKYEKLED
jgi:uncharacterized membrane protein